MSNPVSGSGPKASVRQGDNDVDVTQKESLKSVEPVRYTSQVSEDEGYQSDPSMEKISDRKVQVDPGVPSKRLLDNFKRVFADVRTNLKTFCAGDGARGGRMPVWYQSHIRGDMRYPVAFVRALQQLVPDAAEGLKEVVEANLAEIEVYLSLDEGFEETDVLSAIPSRDLIGLVEAGIAYHVLLGDLKAAEQLVDVWGNYYRGKEEIIFSLQDAQLDLTRDLRLPPR